MILTVTGWKSCTSRSWVSAGSCQYQLMEEKALGRLPFIMVDELEKKNVRVVYQGVEGAYSPASHVRIFR